MTDAAYTLHVYMFKVKKEGEERKSEAGFERKILSYRRKERKSNENIHP